MRLLSLLLILFFVISCKEETIDMSLPECIENIVGDATLSGSLQTVQFQEVKGELHYWLNTDFRHFDGVEYIINNSCDTICAFCGECLPPNCIEDYKGTWEVIWEK